MGRGAGTLIARAPPADLAAYIATFGCRDERPEAEVVRILPEVRASIQVMAEAPYWLRDRTPESAWRRLPEVSFWAPRHSWGYGFADGHVRAYGAYLTPAGFCALRCGPAAQVVDHVLPLADADAVLAAALAPQESDAFDSWLNRAIPALRLAFAGAPDVDTLGAAPTILATAEASAVALAAEAAGISERQFRRLFRDRHGVSPKRFQRAIRVDRMLRQLHARPWEADSHADHPIAFADQPHAIREFRALTGLTPRQYALAKATGDATLRSVAAPEIAPPGES